MEHSSYTLKYLFIGPIQLSATCSGTYDKGKHEITSPDYPHNYHKSITCTWKLEAPHGRRIEIKFLDFYLQQGRDCKYDWIEGYDDWIEVFDGGSDSSPSIKGRICGSKRPPDIVSSTNKLFLKFHTRGRSSKTHFKITYHMKRE